MARKTLKMSVKYILVDPQTQNNSNELTPHRPFQNSNTSYLPAPVAVVYLNCPHCSAKIKKTKLQKHIKKVHAVEAQTVLTPNRAILSNQPHSSSISKAKLEQPSVKSGDIIG